MKWCTDKTLNAADAAWMFIKIGNKRNVFTLCVWVGLCVITGWTLGPAVCHNSMTLPPPPPTAQVRPRQDEFLQFSALFLLWWRLVLVKDCLARRDAQSCPVNPRPLHRHELGVNFAACKASRGAKRDHDICQISLDLQRVSAHHGCSWWRLALCSHLSATVIKVMETHHISLFFVSYFGNVQKIHFAINIEKWFIHESCFLVSTRHKMMGEKNCSGPMKCNRK